MIGLALGEVGVHKVQVAAQSRVEERRPVGRSCSATNKRGLQPPAGIGTAEVGDKFPDRTDRLGVERPDGHSESVKDPDLELAESVVAHLPVVGPLNKLRQLSHLGIGDALHRAVAVQVDGVRFTCLKGVLRHATHLEFISLSQVYLRFLQYIYVP